VLAAVLTAAPELPTSAVLRICIASILADGMCISIGLYFAGNAAGGDERESVRGALRRHPVRMGEEMVAVCLGKGMERRDALVFAEIVGRCEEVFLDCFLGEEEGEKEKEAEQDGAGLTTTFGSFAVGGCVPALIYGGIRSGCDQVWASAGVAFFIICGMSFGLGVWRGVEEEGGKEIAGGKGRRGLETMCVVVVGALGAAAWAKLL